MNKSLLLTLICFFTSLNTNPPDAWAAAVKALVVGSVTASAVFVTDYVCAKKEAQHSCWAEEKGVSEERILICPKCCTRTDLSKALEQWADTALAEKEICPNCKERENKNIFLVLEGDGQKK